MKLDISFVTSVLIAPNLIAPHELLTTSFSIMDAMMSDQMDTMVIMRQMDESPATKLVPNDMDLQHLSALNVTVRYCTV